MKELSIEEKAKAYDEALEIARQYWNNRAMPIGTNFKLERMFPELKENEDERIRKGLLKAVSNILKGNTLYDTDVTREQAIAWLEKQGEQKSTNFIPKFCVGDIVKSKSQPMLRPRKIISIDKDCYRCKDRGCMGFAWEDDYEIVEPKFKVGDTVKDPYGDLYHITEIMDDSYKTDDGRFILFENQEVYTLSNFTTWSEEDEKYTNIVIAALYRPSAEGLYSFHNVKSNDVTNWFKSLKDRVQPQPKQEWNEEDEKYSSYICAALDCYYRLREDRNNTNGQEDLDKARNWLYNKLKFLRPQNSSVTDEELAKAKKDAYNDALDKIEYHSGEPTFDDGWHAAIWYLKKRNTM